VSLIGKADVQCAHCRRPVPKRMAVFFNGEPFHPINCFQRRFEKVTRVLREAGLLPRGAS